MQAEQSACGAFRLGYAAAAYHRNEPDGYTCEYCPESECNDKQGYEIRARKNLPVSVYGDGFAVVYEDIVQRDYHAGCRTGQHCERDDGKSVGIVQSFCESAPFHIRIFYNFYLRL